MTVDLKVNVCLCAFTCANCSACKTDSNNSEQLCDKVLAKMALDFFFFNFLYHFFYVSEVDFRVKYSFNIDFRVKCVAR